MNLLKSACAAMGLVAMVCLTGCLGGPGEPLRSLPMAEAGKAIPTACRESLRIDLADQETEGFHFKVPAAAGTIDHWELYYVPAAQSGADGQSVLLPTPVPLDAFAAQHFLTARLYDCLKVNNPLGATLGAADAPQHVPDALIPMQAEAAGYRSSLDTGDARANRHVWVELSWQVDAAAAAADPARVLAGRHAFRVRGVDAQGQARVDLGFTAVFHGFTLPVQGRFRTLVNWNTTIEGYYGKAVLTPEIRRAYYDFFLRHRLSPTSFNSQAMEPAAADLPYCAAKGQNCINLYTLERQKGMLPQAEVEKIKQISAAAKPLLEQNGLDGSAFVLVCNVAEQSDIESINANADTIHAEMPWAKVWMFVAPNEALAKRINAWTTLTAADTQAFQAISYDAETRSKFAGENDLNLWFVGQEPSSPYANLLLSNRISDAHLLALQTWANNISGLVIPHATAWPWNGAAKADFPAREWEIRRDGLGVLCYPMPSGLPCPSARLVNLRDGLEHAEALREAEFLAYNLDLYNKLFARITLPLLEESLRKFDNVSHTEDVEKRLQAKLLLTRQQYAAIPGQLKALGAVLADYRERFARIDRASTEAQVEEIMTLRRRLYRVMDAAEPLVRQITENLNDPLVPREKPAEPPADLPMPADAPQG